MALTAACKTPRASCARVESPIATMRARNATITHTLRVIGASLIEVGNLECKYRANPAGNETSGRFHFLVEPLGKNHDRSAFFGAASNSIPAHSTSAAGGRNQT